MCSYPVTRKHKNVILQQWYGNDLVDDRASFERGVDLPFTLTQKMEGGELGAGGTE